MASLEEQSITAVAEAASEEGPSAFEELIGDDITLVGLAKSLLSIKTISHIGTIIILSSILHCSATKASMEIISALAFTSLALGYVTIAMLANIEFVKKLVSLPPKQEGAPEASKILRTILSFRITILPLLISAAYFAIGWTQMAEGKPLSGVREYLPWALASLFIIWSIMQARSFGIWSSSLSARMLPKEKEKNANPKIHLFTHTFVILFFAFLGVSFFHLLAGDQMNPGAFFIDDAPFFILALGLHVFSTKATWKHRKSAASEKGKFAFTKRWVLLSQLFITWHLLTVWRQWHMTPNTTEMMFEEIILMIFTVFMAIWALTSRGVSAKLGIFNENTALYWGLGFGYAYAGSVAMLTAVLSDITYVMMTGHIIVIITMLYIQRRMLIKTIDNIDIGREQVEFEAAIKAQREAKEEIASESPQGDGPEQAEENNTPEEPTSESVESESETSDEQEQKQDVTVAEVWQEDNEVDWDGPGATIGSEVEWSDDAIDID